MTSLKEYNTQPVMFKGSEWGNLFHPNQDLNLTIHFHTSWGGSFTGLLKEEGGFLYIELAIEIITEEDKQIYEEMKKKQEKKEFLACWGFVVEPTKNSSTYTYVYFEGKVLSYRKPNSTGGCFYLSFTLSATAIMASDQTWTKKPNDPLKIQSIQLRFLHIQSFLPSINQLKLSLKEYNSGLLSWDFPIEKKKFRYQFFVAEVDENTLEEMKKNHTIQYSPGENAYYYLKITDLEEGNNDLKLQDYVKAINLFLETLSILYGEPLYVLEAWVSWKDPYPYYTILGLYDGDQNSINGKKLRPADSDSDLMSIYAGLLPHIRADFKKIIPQAMEKFRKLNKDLSYLYEVLIKRQGNFGVAIPSFQITYHQFSQYIQWKHGVFDITKKEIDFLNFLKLPTKGVPTLEEIKASIYNPSEKLKEAVKKFWVQVQELLSQDNLKQIFTLENMKDQEFGNAINYLDSQIIKRLNSQIDMNDNNQTIYRYVFEIKKQLSKELRKFIHKYNQTNFPSVEEISQKVQEIFEVFKKKLVPLFFSWTFEQHYSKIEQILNTIKDVYSENKEDSNYNIIGLMRELRNALEHRWEGAASETARQKQHQDIIEKLIPADYYNLSDWICLLLKWALVQDLFDLPPTLIVQIYGFKSWAEEGVSI